MDQERPRAEVYRGRPSASDARVAIVVSRFNEPITEGLLGGARRGLAAGGVPAPDVVEVPGAWEIPIVVERLVRGGRHHAVIALGALIRGETAHFDYIAQAVARGLARTAERGGVPVIFGVLTTENAAQARARSEEGPKNKGDEAARAALEMIDLWRRLDEAGV